MLVIVSVRCSRRPSGSKQMRLRMRSMVTRVTSKGHSSTMVESIYSMRGCMFRRSSGGSCRIQARKPIFLSPAEWISHGFEVTCQVLFIAKKRRSGVRLVHECMEYKFLTQMCVCSDASGDRGETEYAESSIIDRRAWNCACKAPFLLFLVHGPRFPLSATLASRQVADRCSWARKEFPHPDKLPLRYLALWWWVLGWRWHPRKVTSLPFQTNGCNTWEFESNWTTHAARQGLHRLHPLTCPHLRRT